MGKGEIACYEQFLLFPQCIQKAYFPGASKGVIVWEWVKQTIPSFNNAYREAQHQPHKSKVSGLKPMIGGLNL